MVRTLLILMVASFVVGAVSFGAAAGIGGAQFREHGFSMMKGFDFQFDDDDGEAVRIDWDSPETTRTVDWSGAQDIDFDVPADITYTQGPTPRLVITGPKDAVDHVTVNGGEIRLRERIVGNVKVDGDPIHGGLNVKVEGMEGRRRLKIEVTNPHVQSIEVSRTGNLTLTNIQEDHLRLEGHSAAQIHGRVDIRSLELGSHSAARLELEGRADDLEIDAHSGATANVENLVVKSARVDAHSGASVRMSARDSAEIEAHSGAHVILYGKPSDLDINRHSGGDVDVRDARSASAPSEPAKPADPLPVPGAAKPAPPAPPAKPAA